MRISLKKVKVLPLWLHASSVAEEAGQTAEDVPIGTEERVVGCAVGVVRYGGVIFARVALSSTHASFGGGRADPCFQYEKRAACLP